MAAPLVDQLPLNVPVFQILLSLVDQDLRYAITATSTAAPQAKCAHRLHPLWRWRVLDGGLSRWRPTARRIGAAATAPAAAARCCARRPSAARAAAWARSNACRPGAPR
jgi:hypothetical protein